MIRRVRECALIFAVAGVVLLLPSGKSQACCGQLVDIYQCDATPQLLDACAGDEATVSGLIYEYYWAGGLNQWPMGVTIVITDENDVVVRTITADVTQTGGGGSLGVDDDNDGLIDEDPGWPTTGVDDDNDGRIDEDGGVPGDEYADFTFSATWDCKDDDGEMVAQGVYDMAVTAQAGDMGFSTVYEQAATTTEEPCCVEGGSVNITPETLNKKSGGRWITGHVIPPEGYTVYDVTGGTVISVNGTEVEIPGTVRSPDEDGAVIKFPRGAVVAWLPEVPGGPSGHGMSGRIEDVEICIEVMLGEEEVTCALCDGVDVIHEAGAPPEMDSMAAPAELRDFGQRGD